MLNALVKTMRPRQWTKNGFIFFALIFDKQLLLWEPFVRTLAGFFLFCLVSSAVYLLNDIADVEADRSHPEKRFRPIAAGELSVPFAIGLAVALIVVGLAGALAAEGLTIAGLVLAYGVGTTLYSYVLKHEVILDVMTIAGLFVLRVLAGAIAVDADASAFLLLCTGMVALFLGFTKRRQEATSELHSGTSSRPVLEHYSIPFLDQMVAMVTAATVMRATIKPRWTRVFPNRENSAAAGMRRPCGNCPDPGSRQ